jgi:hypothetical protein
MPLSAGQNINFNKKNTSGSWLYADPEGGTTQVIITAVRVPQIQQNIRHGFTITAIKY